MNKHLAYSGWFLSPKKKKTANTVNNATLPAVDPGFRRGGGGGTNSPGGGGGRQHTILPNFPNNHMKLKEFGCPGGGGAPLAPP